MVAFFRAGGQLDQKQSQLSNLVGKLKCRIRHLCSPTQSRVHRENAGGEIEMSTVRMEMDFSGPWRSPKVRCFGGQSASGAFSSVLRRASGMMPTFDRVEALFQSSSLLHQAPQQAPEFHSMSHVHIPYLTLNQERAVFTISRLVIYNAQV
jgi:hypothetical protein